MRWSRCSRILAASGWLLAMAAGSEALASCPAGLALPDDDQAQHLRGIETHRRLQNEAFSEPATTPLLAQDLIGFSGLRYFPVDPGYLLAARFRASSGKATFELPTFNGERQRYSEYGKLSFCLQSGQPTELTLYRREDAGPMGRLTVIAPFRDLTNGTQTYSGGRYLKFLLPLAQPARIDFNRAVNPYCAYNPDLPCPIPPRSNWMTVAVPAGEKDYVRH